jgi:hypothetical protein
MTVKKMCKVLKSMLNFGSKGGKKGKMMLKKHLVNHKER